MTEAEMRLRARVRVVVAGLAVVLAVPATGTAGVAGEGPRFRDAVVGAKGVVAAAHPLAGRVGVDVLESGGNAVDAAVAAVFAVGVVRPEMCGVGGGGFLVYRGASGVTAALDFRETAPVAHEHGPGVAEAGPWAYVTGHNRVGVPGTVRGLHAAWRRFGRTSWADLVEPARVLAADGFPVSEHLAQQMAVHAQRLSLYPASARAFLIAGVVPHPAGTTLRQPELAESLAAIRDGGPKAFYRGAIAEAIVASMAASGSLAGDHGFLSLDDLKAYRPVWRSPLFGSYRGADIIAMPPPTSGGLATIEVLNLLEGYDVARWGRGSADYLHHLAEAQKLAWADRNAFVADPDFVDVPTDMMTSKGYAAQRRSEIQKGSARESYEAGAPSAWPADSGSGGTDTTHISVIDAQGNAVAVTCSLEAAFGSAVVAPGTGVLLNGQLADFGAAGTANEPAGGKRPRSSMSPTIVVRGGLPVLVTGAAGGTAIPMAVVQQIVGMTDFGLSLAQAIDAERADARACESGGPLVLCLDFARIAPDVQADLTARGHQLGYPGCALLAASGYPCDPAYHRYAEAQSAGVDPVSGTRQAVSDPRGEWGAAVQSPGG
jgi:gamma-glutamyltranspeptidase / glutathione hydrolase